MEILIVDDSEEKISKIQSVIEESLVKASITVTKNSSQSVMYLKERAPDLMILDINLPVRDGEDAKREAGISLLKDIVRFPNIKKPNTIIGLTSFEDILSDYQKLFSRQGWLLVSFNPKYTDWEETIKNKISYLSNKKEMMRTEERARILIFSAISKEFIQIRSFLNNVTVDFNDSTGSIYETGTYNGWTITLVETGVGNIKSGIEVERAMARYKPQYALFVGIGGGIKDVNIGDVVIGTKVYNYESGKDDIEFQSRQNIGNSSYMLEQIAKLISRNTEWLSKLNEDIGQRNIFSDQVKCFVAPIASGEKVVSSKKSTTFKAIKKHSGDSLTVAMEESGFLESCRAHDVKALVIRGISDLIDGKSGADKTGSQEFATLTASLVAFEIIAKINDFQK